MERPAPTDEQTAVPKLTIAIVLIAIVAGIALRTVEMVHNRPLWLDEAMLSLNIASRSFASLARPLDYDQSAPLLYLWLERAVVSVAGVSERSLRAIPFAAGVMIVPGTWLVMRRFVGNAAAAIATVLVALSVALISFSAEAKQYGVDPLATLIVLWLAIRVRSVPRDARRWLALGAGGIGCLLLSQPAAFVLAGVVLALAAEPSIRRDVNARRWLIGSAAIWALVFAILYVVVYRATAQSPYMRHFWEGTFLDPRAPDFLARVELLAIAVFGAPILTGKALGSGAPLAVLWVVTIVVIARRSRFVAIALSAPLLLAVAACAIGSYAVMDRLFLFAAPVTLAGISAFAAAILQRTSARSLALVATCAGLAAIVTPTHVQRVSRPVFYAVGKQVIAEVDAMAKGDAVYVAARSFPLWMFYTTDWRAPDVERLAWAASIAGAGAPAHNNAPSRGAPVREYEATRLARKYRGRVEIVGLPTGRHYATSTRSLDRSISPAELAVPAQPDSGWAQLEAQRMAAAARPRVWVFGSHMFALDGAEPSLIAELQRRGTRLLMERRQGTTVGYHVEFPGEP